MLTCIMDSAEKRRSRRLASITIRKTYLGAPEQDDDPNGLEGFTLAARLSHEVWTLTGQKYTRVPRST